VCSAGALKYAGPREARCTRMDPACTLRSTGGLLTLRAGAAVGAKGAIVTLALAGGGGAAEVPAEVRRFSSQYGVTMPSLRPFIQEGEVRLSGKLAAWMLRAYRHYDSTVPLHPQYGITTSSLRHHNAPGGAASLLRTV
jgi:hypothetical protein